MTGESSLDAVQRLVELEAIKRLKYRYLRCLDQKRWDELEGCLADDATASYGGGSVVLSGRAGIMEFLRSRMGATTMLTSHRCHHPEIDIALAAAPGAAAPWPTGSAST